jgi:hypothetical protein
MDYGMKSISLAGFHIKGMGHAIGRLFKGEQVEDSHIQVESESAQVECRASLRQQSVAHVSVSAYRRRVSGPLA